MIYQGRLEDADGRWSGYPDFVVRVQHPSGLGGWSYEVVDAKLAQTARGAALLQHVQGAAPDQMHLALVRILDQAPVQHQAGRDPCSHAGSRRSPLGSGTGSPNSFAVSIQSSIA